MDDYNRGYKACMEVCGDQVCKAVELADGKGEEELLRMLLAMLTAWATFITGLNAGELPGAKRGAN